MNKRLRYIYIRMLSKESTVIIDTSVFISMGVNYKALGPQFLSLSDYRAKIEAAKHG